MRWKYLLCCIIVLLGLNSCKKAATPTPTSAALILGKWFKVQHTSGLYYNGLKIDTATSTKFTTDDFVEYFNSGTGYYSVAASGGPDLSEFTYTIKGALLTEFSSVVDKGTPITITNLTASSLSLHVASTVIDPNDDNKLDTEIDYYVYSR